MKNMMIMVIALVSFTCCASEDQKKSGGDTKAACTIEREMRELIILPHGYGLYLRQLAEQQEKPLPQETPRYVDTKKLEKISDWYEKCP